MVPSWGAAVLRPYMNVAVRELRRVMDRAKVLGKARDLENDRGYRVAGIHRADMGRSGLRLHLHVGLLVASDRRRGEPSPYRTRRDAAVGKEEG